MRTKDVNSQFWLKWGCGSKEEYYNESKYENVEGFDGNTVHKVTFQDEKGRELTASFEAFRSTSTEIPALGLTMLSIIRQDTNENVSVGEGLYKEFFDHAMVRICESDEEILENVPAW